MKMRKFAILYLAFFSVYLSITLGSIFDPPPGGRKFPGSEPSHTIRERSGPIEVDVEQFPEEGKVKIEVIEYEQEGVPSTRTRIKERLSEEGSRGYVGGFQEDVHKLGEVHHRGMFDLFGFFGDQYDHLKHFLFGKAAEGAYEYGKGKEAIQQTIRQGKDAIYETTEKGKETLYETAEKGKETLQYGKEKLGEVYETTKGKVEEVAETVKETVKDKVGSIPGKVEEKGKEIYRSAKDTAQEMGKKAAETAETLTEVAEQTYDTLKRKGERTIETVKEVSEELTGKVEGAAETLKQKAQTLTDKTAGTVEQGKEMAKEAGYYVLEKMENVYEGAKERIEETTDTGKNLARKLYLTIRNILSGSKQQAKRKMAAVTTDLTPFQEIELYWTEFITAIPEISEQTKKRLKDEGIRAIQTLESKKTLMDSKGFDQAKQKLRDEMDYLEKNFGRQIEAVKNRFENLWRRIQVAHQTGKIDFNLPHHTVMKCGSCGKEYSFVDFLDMFEDFDHDMSFPDSLPSNEKELEEFYEGWANWANYLKLKCPECHASNWHELVILEPQRS